MRFGYFARADPPSDDEPTWAEANPVAGFHAGLLVALGSACRAQELALTGLTLTDDSGLVTGAFGERRVGPDTWRSVLESMNVTKMDECTLVFDDAWSELLYDLGAHTDRLAITPLGLRYRRVCRLSEDTAQVSLSNAESCFEFLVRLEDRDPPIGLPETLHDWAHRHPRGFTDPARI